MTSIKPPAPGSTSSHPTADAATADSASPSAATGESTSVAGTFKATVQQGNADSAVPSSSHIAAQATQAGRAGQDALTSLVQQVQAGRVNMEQAVEQLLQHTVSSVGARLSAAQRAELSDLLRAALANDPTLRSLRNGG